VSSFVMRLPDVGEGVAEAELVSWLVAVGDEVTPDSVLAEVLTDKATVEISSPVTGVVTMLHGEPGDLLAVGGELIEIDTGGENGLSTEAEPDVAPRPEASNPARAPAPDPAPDRDRDRASDREPETDRDRPAAAPAVRARARALGIDLDAVPGSGPGGRIVHTDLDRVIAAGPSATASRAARSDVGRPEPIRGVRRRIAERLSAAWAEIPHITYVDAVDITELEHLRERLNARNAQRGAVRLTILPLLARAIAIACAEQPRLNAHYDQTQQTLTTFDAVHIGIATQTTNGLLVPVVRHVEAQSIWELATEITRVTTAARDGSATREELSGSTITITSLGALGGLVTTPIVNPPEVAIVGVNKIETRPSWSNGGFQPRQMFNLSSSFDHRLIDGWDAATFVQRIKSLLETPSLLFLDS
jgi:2-oxoisovalerate dehydrogenase E2 component (dihydrolipoyl transacylase)